VVAEGYRGRFAPSPTGPLHLGSLLTAVGSFLDARAAGGTWLLRMEDIDPPREQPGAAEAILASLRQHGLHWDGEVLYQSTRHAAYRAALDDLAAQNLVFPCSCTRATLGPGGSCGGRCKPRAGQPVALRLRLDAALQAWEDGFRGAQPAPAGRADIVLWRKDNLPAYQLAVTVDDRDQCISNVVRGADLIAETALQRHILTRLGATPPHYAHVPLLCAADGRKLSKQNGAPAITDRHALANLRRVLHLLGQGSAAAAADSPEELLRVATDGWTPIALRSTGVQIVYAEAT
jgi:glutamyl-Q tRNA(Asp) synthetase